jgi:hypothetical protein
MKEIKVIILVDNDEIEKKENLKKEYNILLNKYHSLRKEINRKIDHLAEMENMGYDEDSLPYKFTLNLIDQKIEEITEVRDKLIILKRN